MKICYIFHGCFTIESDKCAVIIDYVKDTHGADNRMKVRNILKNRKIRIYVLCTNASAENFNSEIFSWRYLHPDIRYILSKDIESAYLPPTCRFMEPNETFHDELLKIDTVPSSGNGLMFLLNMDGKYLLHAGRSEWAGDTCLFHMHVPYIDMAFIPMRMGRCRSCSDEAERMLKNIRVKRICPMYFGNDFVRFSGFEKTAAKYDCKYSPCSREGSVITI